MTKLLILLAVISNCSAGIIPKDFRAKEHALPSKSEISDGDDWDNCFKKVRFGRLTSEKSDSGTKEHHPNQLTEKFQNSVHEIDVGELKNAAFAESFVVYADSNKEQRSLKTEFGIHTNELKTTENSLSEIFSSHFDSSKESKLRNSKENKLDQQTESFQIPLQNTGIGEDVKAVFSKSFVEYADANKNQRSLRTKNQNISELEIRENLSEVLVANVDTSVDNKLTHFKDNLNQSTEELRTFLQRTGDGVLNKTEVFTESFVEYALSNETEESLAEFQMAKIKEIETVVNFSETTVASFNISENSKMEVHDINTDSSEINLTDTEVSSVFDLIASAINASDVFEYLNLTDSLSFDVVTENISSGFLDVDETALMSEGSEIAVFQDDSTTGFEFLIDSETTKNLILTELLKSESFVVTENGKIGFLEELPDSFPEIIELNELDIGRDNLIGIIETNNLEIPVEGTLDQTEALDVATEIEVENRTVMNTSAISATVSAEEALVSTNFNSSTTFEEQSKVTDETNFSDDVIASTDSSKTCPLPGICFLWFFAQDKCSDSSECRGTSICCKMGCSKICVDI